MSITDKIGYSGMTATEDFQNIRNFVVSRSNSAKDQHDLIYKEYDDKIGNPEFKAILKDYYTESKNASVFKSQQSILEKYLKEIYVINHTHIVKDRAFAENLVNENGHKIHISLEAQQLLKGSQNYSTEVAAKEAATLREKLQLQGAQLTASMKENKDLVIRATQLNTALTNLVGNLKVKLKLGEEMINEMMSNPPAKEAKQDQTKSKDIKPAKVSGKQKDNDTQIGM